MKRNNFIRSKGDSKTKLYILNAPLVIEIPQKIVEKLRSEYVPKPEIGGVLFAEPILVNEERILRIKKLKSLPNISEKPESQYLGKNRIQVMHSGLMGTKSGLHYLPIIFHSHPQPDSKADQYYIINRFIGLETSDKDREAANQPLDYETIGVSMLFPRALIYLIDDKLFIGFYGGKIAPDNFNEYMRKIAGKSLENMISDFAGLVKDTDEFWTRALGIVGVTLTSISYPFILSQPALLRMLITQILIHHKKQQTYFTITKNEDVKVLIP